MVNVQLKDDGIKPLASNNKFKIIVSKPIVKAPGKGIWTTKAKVSSRLDAWVDNINSFGVVRIKFS